MFIFFHRYHDRKLLEHSPRSFPQSHRANWHDSEVQQALLGKASDISLPESERWIPNYWDNQKLSIGGTGLTAILTSIYPFPK